MKAGDYVRLPNGIHKIKEYEYRPEYENCHCMYLDDNDYGLLFTDKELIKHSPNIIDLIEVGDYVNGSKVIDIAQAPIKVIYTEQETGGALLPTTNNRIESVLTKEQFESMEYKVKE